MKILLRLIAVLAIAGAMAALYFLPPVNAPTEVTASSQRIGVEPLPLQAACPGPLVEVGGVQGTDLGAIARLGSPLV